MGWIKRDLVHLKNKKRASQATQRNNGLDQERSGSGGVDHTGEDMVGRADKEVERKHRFEEKGRGTDDKEANFRKITGHVEDESLWLLGKCLIGTMATVCSAETVKDRLHSWGLGDTMVKSLGGQKFLLRIQDEELLKLLEEQKWSLLEEVFANMEKWTEKFHVEERTVWVEVRGIPLHCWNQLTFKRIAEIWGHLIALGENGNQYFDGEKVTLLISTSQWRKIEESVVLEVGTENFVLWVSEVPTIQLQYSNRRKNLTKKFVRDDVEDSSLASSTSMESQKRKSHKGDQNEEPSLGTKNPQDTPTAKVGMLNAHSESISEGGSLSEPVKNDEYGFNSDNERQNHQVAQENIQLTNQRVSWAGVVKAAQLSTRDQKAHCPLEDRIIGDLVDMGFGKNEISPKLVANGLSETSCLKLDDDSGECQKKSQPKNHRS
ncbi:hypothetical protein GQ457_13G026460 [Hibiscus cannabinus]